MNSDLESLGEGTTDVLLGFVDVPISEKEQPTLEDTFIGGSPIWLKGVAPNSDLTKCLNCGKPCSLLLQTFATLNNNNDRVLYVFGCRDYRCNRKNGSIRCIKGLVFRKNDTQVAEMRIGEANKDLFGTSFAEANSGSTSKKNPFTNDNPFTKENPFSKGNPFAKENPFKESNPFAKSTMTATLAKTDDEAETKAPSKAEETKESAKSKGDDEKETAVVDANAYPGYILYLENEVLVSDDEILPKIPQNIEVENEEEEKEIRSSKVQEFDSDVLQDKHFQNFSKRVAHNPQQVFRYELGGAPLIYSSKDKVLSEAPSPKFNPKSRRQFEFQLMPKMIIDLESESQSIEGMEWGTVLVYTDVEDFVPADMRARGVGYVEEFCVVEWEDALVFNNNAK